LLPRREKRLRYGLPGLRSIHRSEGLVRLTTTVKMSQNSGTRFAPISAERPAAVHECHAPVTNVTRPSRMSRARHECPAPVTPVTRPPRLPPRPPFHVTFPSPYRRKRYVERARTPIAPLRRAPGTPALRGRHLHVTNQSERRDRPSGGAFRNPPRRGLSHRTDHARLSWKAPRVPRLPGRGERPRGPRRGPPLIRSRTISS